MEDLNKITSTRVGDNIHFFVNGTEDSGTVVKMDTSYVTVVKRDGNFQDIHINDTFFIKDILVNKSWNDMTMEERTVELHKVHAYSPRFLAKAWKELPQSLKDVMKIRNSKGKLLPNENDNDLSDKQSKESMAATTRYRGVGEGAGKKVGNNRITHADGAEIGNINFYKPNKDKTPPSGNTQDKYPAGGYLEDKPRLINQSNVEQGHLGSAGRSGQVVETNTDFDAPDDYEGQTEDEKKEQFKHEDKKPETTNKSSRARYGGNQSSGTTLRPNDIKELQELETKKEPPAVATSDTKYFGANGKQITREEHDSSSDIKQSYGSMQEQLWEEWLDKGEGGMGDGSAPANNGSSSTNENGMYNPVYGEKGRHGGQGKDKEEDEDKDDKDKQQ